MVLRKHRAAVLVHGCFWHRHKRCKFAYTPKSNREFWTTKFAANVERDERQRRQLIKSGWRVFIIWECQARQPGYLEKLYLSIVRERRKQSGGKRAE